MLLKIFRTNAKVSNKVSKKIRVAELFAGVGGFRIGLEETNRMLGSEQFQVVFSNQWEPAEKGQFASRVYVHRWGAIGHSNEDISKVEASSLPAIDLLVGGFPCQDYSVARPLNQASGLVGKKGVLWWEIHRIASVKKPKYLLLENVDRLLSSPAGHRGRDFALILSSLNDLGYAVEWRVINAGEYGFPQRRKRTFILAYKAGTKAAKLAAQDPVSWLKSTGTISKGFPATFDELAHDKTFNIVGDVYEISENFNKSPKALSPFRNAGVCVDRVVHTAKAIPLSTNKGFTLGDVLIPESCVPFEFFITDKELEKWKYQKGAKSLQRTKKNGIQYSYDEGSMAFPDHLDRPARTIITGEGGRTPSRFKHVVKTPSGRYRRLTPLELERLNQFPDEHTKLDGITDARRAFFMGNALVTGVVTQLALKLAELKD